ncbi:MAG: hypothetical protein ACKPFK_23475, partial [Dolichospermum sp.]
MPKVGLGKLYAKAGDFVDFIDLSEKALNFSKNAMTAIARRAAEEHFVRSNYHNKRFKKLQADYTYTNNALGADPYYSGFSEPGYLNPNYELGSDPGPYKIDDPDTGEKVQISRLYIYKQCIRVRPILFRFFGTWLS